MSRLAARFATLTTVLALAAAVVLPGGATAAPRATTAATAQLVAEGGGWGHGVGMSQFGAEGYAAHGKRYRWILGRYYKGTKLGKARGRSVRVLLGTSGPVTLTGLAKAGRRKLNPRVAYRASVAGSAIALRGGGRTVRLAPKTPVSGRGTVGVAGKGRYRGVLLLSVNDDGDLRVVNKVGLEDYVRAVVPAEVYSSWHAETLKAQAVTARTYAITVVKGDGRDYDQVDDVRSQQYDGAGKETAATDAAVRATRGQVVTYRGRAVPTYFHSSSGGHTEGAAVGFGQGEDLPWLVGVEDPYDGDSGLNQYDRWLRRFPLARAQTALRDAGLLDGSLLGIEVLGRGASPRIASARILGTGGETTTTGFKLKEALLLPDIPSSLTLVR
jgi:stage II sporulation protein D